MSDQIPVLVKGFVSGSEADFAELIRIFRRKIYAVAYKFLGNHLDADEVVQETFVRVHRKRKELGDVKYFSTFLVRIATNYSIDLLRKRKGHSGLDEESNGLPGSVQLDLSRRVATPSDNFENKRLMKEINLALEQLPPRQKLTAVLHDVEGFTKSEVADIMECPKATVRSNLHIARTKLKRILKQRL